MFELIGYIFAYLIIRPFFLVCQAVAGILAAGPSPEQVRLQRLAVVALVLGVLLILGLLFLSVELSLSLSIVLYAAGFALLAIGAAIGRRLERDRALKGED